MSTWLIVSGPMVRKNIVAEVQMQESCWLSSGQEGKKKEGLNIPFGVKTRLVKRTETDDLLVTLK